MATCGQVKNRESSMPKPQLIAVAADGRNAHGIGSTRDHPVPHVTDYLVADFEFWPCGPDPTDTAHVIKPKQRKYIIEQSPESGAANQANPQATQSLARKVDVSVPEL